MIPVCFASDDVNLNSTLTTSEVNDYVLSEDEGYKHIYVNASASDVGDGSKESPYKELSSVYPVFEKDTVVHIADGYYKYNYNNSGQIVNFMQITSNVKFIGESAENTTIDFSGKGIYAFIEWNPNIYFKDIKLFNTSVNLISYNGQAQYGGTLEAENTIFDSAKSIAYNGAYYIGGAISSSGQLKLTDCIFKNNTADRGGAIFALIGGELKNCTFINNKARFDGGAIFTPNNQMLVHNSKFINNTASREGGAVYSVANLLLNNSDLKYNIAYSGGAVYIVNCQLIIHNSNFTNNYAISHGGAIISTNSPYFYIKGARFINDTSNSSAGAIYSMNSKMFFYDSVFANCSSLIGGAICDLYSSAIFSNMNFTNNSATKGGAVYKMYNTTSITGSTFNSNKAHDGGGLYVDQISSAILTNLKFNNNTANYGGDIYCLGDAKNINATNIGSPDAFNLAFLNLNQKAGDYKIFEIDDVAPVLDSRYDMREHYNLTEVKNQLEQGNCWAFAAMAALESCILKANGTGYDFSEENLKNIVARFSDYGNFASVPNSGGNFFMTIGYLASWLGPISEENEIYSPNPLSLLYDAITHVQNVIFLPRMSFTDNDGIKEAIVKYGAVVTSMYYSDDYLANDKVSYYVNGLNLQTNHDVAIVGWDDNYPKEKFKTEPPENGAFIVRNSWGPDWGENGYFYVSYYDLYFTRVGNTNQPSFTFVLNDTNHYDKNYQHEIQISNFATLQAETTSLGIGNSFRAESDELVSAVSTYFSDYSNYTISIFVNNQLKHSQQGNTTAGYFTIPLTKYVPVKKDDTFDVMFMITNLNNQKPLLYFFEYSKNSRFAKNGISFYSDDYGKNWYNAFEKLGGVIPIKGFTKYGKLNTSIEVSGWDCDWTINKNVTLQVRVKDQFGDYIGNGNVTFLIDGEAFTVKLVDSVANETVLFTQAGKHNITVLFDAVDYYYSSNISKLITINPANTVLSLSLSNDTLLVGEPLTVSAVVNATQGKVSFFINGVLNDTVDVDSDGVAVLNLNGLNYGGYNLTAVFSDDAGTYLNSSNRSAFSVYSNTVLEVGGWDCDWTVNRNVTLQVRVKDQFGDYICDGDVVFLIDGEAFTVKLVDSVANETVLFTQVGEHNITVLFDAVDYYYSSNISKLITINPANTVLSLSLSNDTLLVGEPLTVSAVVNATQGKVSFFINGVLNDTVGVDSDGVARLVLTNLKYGGYNLTAVFSDDMGTYLNSSNKTVFVVFARTFIEVDGWDCDWTVNRNVTLQVRVKDQFGDYIGDGDVVFLIDGEAFIVKLVDSVANETVLFTQVGEHNITVLFDAVDYYYSSNISKLIDISPLSTSLSLFLSNDTLLVGESLTVSAVVNATQGKVCFYLNGVLNDTVGVDSDGVAVLNLNNLNYGHYNLTAVFTDDKGTYLNSSDKSGFTVIYPIEIIAEDLTKYYNESDRFPARIIGHDGKGISNQNVKFTIENTTYETLTDSNGYAYLSASLQPGEYAVKTIYENLEVSNLIIILPTLLDKDMNISSSDIYDDETEVINVVLPKDATGNVSTIVNNKKYYANVNEGIANIPISDLKYGNYNIDVIYSGDEKYNSVKGNTSFTVKKSQIHISAPDVTKYYNGPERFVVTVKYNDKPLNNATVTININDVDYKRTTDKNGVASIGISIDSGVYNVTTEYNGTKVYSTVAVKSTIAGNNITKIFRNGTQYFAGFIDSQGNVLKNTNVNFNINGVFYTRATNDEGIARLNINLNPGQYILTATNPSNGERQANIINVLSSIVENHDLTKYYKNASRFTFRLLDDQGKPVGAGVSATLNINGVFYTRTTDANGYIKMNINLNPGTYIVTVMYNGLNVANTIKVLPILEAKDVVMKYRDGTKFEAKLLDGQGKPYAGQTLTFNINGVFYNRITDNAGIARLNINLMPGEYIITSMYENGAAISNKITISG